MNRLEELGCELRATATAETPPLARVMARAAERRRRHRAALGMAVLLFLGTVALVTLAALPGPGGDPGRRAAGGTGIAALGTGPSIWPDDGTVLASPGELAGAFADQVLGEGWTWRADRQEVGVFLSFERIDGASVVMARAAERESGGWALEELSTLARGNELRVPWGDLYLDRRSGFSVGRGGLDNRVSTIELYHRPVGSDTVFGGRESDPDGHWTVPGSVTPADVGSLLLVARDLDGAVLGVSGWALGGVGVDLELDPPWTETDELPFLIATEPLRPSGEGRWPYRRRLEVDDGHTVLLSVSSDGSRLCATITRQPSGEAAGECLPTWRFLLDGVTWATGGPDGPGGEKIVLRPSPRGEDSELGAGEVLAGGYVLVVPGAAPG